MHIDEAWQIFLLGLVPFEITITFGVWGVYKALKKHVQATRTLVVGLILAAIMTLSLFYLFGWIPRPSSTPNVPIHAPSNLLLPDFAVYISQRSVQYIPILSSILGGFTNIVVLWLYSKYLKRRKSNYFLS